MADLGFVGVGLMGHGMAANLLRAGHTLTVIAHKNRAPVEDLVARGAAEAADLASLARGRDAILLCVSNSKVVESVIGEMEPALEAGQLIVDATTADPSSTRRLFARLAERGVEMADAPVTGSSAKAKAGQLASLVGAEPSVFPRVEALISAYASTIRHFGPPGSGHEAKLVNNVVTMGTAALLTEAYLMAQRLGLDWRALHEVMANGAARSGTLEFLVGPAVEGDYRGLAFTLENAAKDVRTYCAMAAGRSALSPLARILREYYETAVTAGHGARYVSELLDPELSGLGARPDLPAPEEG